MKRVISFVMSIVMATSVLPLSILEVSAVSTNPWNSSAEWPSLSAKNNLVPGQKYFTGNEWTGIVSSKDINNNDVRQSDVYQVNREPAHSSETLAYDSVEKAVIGSSQYKMDESPYYKLLTGEGNNWDLTVYKNLTDAQNAGVVSSFYKTDYSGVQQNPYTGKNKVSKSTDADYGCGWKSVTLPASWLTQGFDFPIYSNIDIPWLGAYGNEGGSASANVPKAPTVTNPVGFYRKNFDVDSDWLKNGKKVYISFQGVESAMYLYVNGNEVGYTEDSFDAHDFDITSFLNADGKNNTLAVRVHRWCDGSWLEDQDFLRAAGIFRDVYLYATPAVHIRDYKVGTDLDDNFVNSDLNLNLNIKNNSTTTVSNFGVDVKLFDANGVDLFEQSPLRADVSEIKSDEESVLNISRFVENPKLWSDENPYLYTLVISLYDKTSGKHYESLAQQLGFREITFTKTKVDSNYNKVATNYQRILLNGKPFELRGVNRHDNNLFTGRYVDHNLYTKDIQLMKKNNINALRTSHYPNDRYLYYLCDKYGLLVMAEANAESHALQGDSDNMANHMTNVYNDRLTANLQAHKNRTSVIMWSLGNESGNTPNTKMFQKAIQNIIRTIDSTRPVHYEGLYDGGGVDVASTMYSDIKSMNNNANNLGTMPYLMCEYAHAMGNAVGGLKEYWEAIRSHDNMLGAFIWDWVDQTVATDIPSQKKVTADLSSNNFVGILNGNLVDDGEWGKVLDGYVTFPTNLNPNSEKINNALSGKNSFTLEALIKPTAKQGFQSIISKGDHQVALRTNNSNDIDFYIYNGGWQQNTYVMPADWADNWHQIVAIFNGTYLNVYCDGAPLQNRGGNNPITADISKSSFDLAINYCTENKGRQGYGKVAKARIYKKALSVSEMNTQRNADKDTGEYAINSNDDSVLMWCDFTTATTSDYFDNFWDYYGEIGRTDMAGKYFGYGGNWGDTVNAGSFMQNGLVSADRTPQPELQEVKHIYQPINFTASVNDIISKQVNVKNHMSFSDINKYDLVWEVIEDGKAVTSGKINSSVSALSTQKINVNYTLPQTLKDDSEYYLNVYAKYKQDTFWAKAGDVVASEQIRIPSDIKNVPQKDRSDMTVLNNEETTSNINITGGKFTVSVNKSTGLLENYVYDDNTIFNVGPKPNYARARVDNDRSGIDDRWASANKNMKLTSIEKVASTDKKTLEITVKYQLTTASNSVQQMKYTIYGSGEISVVSSLNPASGLGELLKFGAELTLPKSFENIKYYGAGPEDNYQDRKTGSPLGYYTTTVSDSYFPFETPQACGNHTDVRYMAVEDENIATGLMVVAKNVIEAGALHFSTDELSGKGHPYELPNTDHTIFNIDYRSRGIGNESCMYVPPLEPYKMYTNQNFSYEYTLVPYNKATDDINAVSKQWRDAEAFNLDEYIKQRAEETEKLIDKISILLSYNQKADIIAARQSFDALSDSQKALVQNIDVLTDAENKIESFKNSTAIINDKSLNNLFGNITSTAKIFKDNSSINGYAMEGYFIVKSTLFNSNINRQNGFTYDAWVKLDDLDADNIIFAKGDTFASLKTYNEGFEFFVYNGNRTTLKVKYPANFKVSDWHHITATYNGSNLALYYNGNILGNIACTAELKTNAFSMGIGADTQRNKYLRGQLSVARILTKALTATEISKLHEADVEKTGGPVLATDKSVLAWYEAKTYHSGAALDITAPQLSLQPGKVQSGSKLQFTSTVAGAKIMYSIDDGKSWAEYKSPIILTKSVTVKVYAVKNEFKSAVGTYAFIVVPKNGWIQKNNKYYYYKNDVLVKNKWIDSIYRTDSSGARIVNKVVKISGKYYAFLSSGKVCTKTGWTKIGKDTYYIKKKVVQTNKLIKVSKKYYIVNSKGVKQLGTKLVSLKGKQYAIKRNVVQQNAWVKISKKYYRTKSSGEIIKGKTVKIGSKKYTFNKKGICTNK